MTNAHNYNSFTLIGNWYEDRYIPNHNNTKYKDYHTAAKSKYISSTPIQDNRYKDIKLNTTTNEMYQKPTINKTNQHKSFISQHTAQQYINQQPQLLNNITNKQHNNNNNNIFEPHLKTNKDLIFPTDNNNSYKTIQPVTKSSYKPHDTIHHKQQLINLHTTQLMNTGAGELLRNNNNHQPTHNTEIQRSWLPNKHILKYYRK